MKLLKKIVLVVLLVAGAAVGLKIYNPDAYSKFVSPFVKNSGNVLGETQKQVKKVLGVEVEIKQPEDINLEETENESAQESIKPIMENKAVKETVNKIDKIVKDKINEEVGDIKKIPQEQIDKIKEEVRKEVKRQICEEWLKNE